MVIYLRHDRHGTKVAISELEAKQDEKNGWKRYTLAEPNLPPPRNTLSLAQGKGKR
jgi:hypothetical protein